jgi:hypothetical protein
MTHSCDARKYIILPGPSHSNSLYRLPSQEMSITFFIWGKIGVSHFQLQTGSTHLAADTHNYYSESYLFSRLSHRFSFIPSFFMSSREEYCVLFSHLRIEFHIYKQLSYLGFFYFHYEIFKESYNMTT